MRIGILASHPIQYQTPLFAELARRVEVQVFFAHRISDAEQSAAGFGVPFQWDRPLLEGYPHRFLQNRAARPSVQRYPGCDTPEIDRCVAEGRFDMFVVNGWFLKTFWQAATACRRQRVPVAAFCDSVLPAQEGLLRRWARRWVMPRRLRRFDAFLSTGVRNRQYLRHFGVPDSRIHYLPHHVDVDWLRRQIRDCGPKVCPGSELRLLFVGKLIELKRVEDLIEAAAILGRRSSRRVRVIVAGSGPCREALQRLTADRGVAADFLGFKNQTELPAIYRSADLLVLPSRSETWGLVVNEALACGTAAVVSDAVGCGPDMIEPVVTGAVFPAGDPAGLAAAIERMMPVLGSPASLDQIEKTSDAHSVSRAAEHYLAAAERIAADRGARPWTAPTGRLSTAPAQAAVQ